MNLAYGIGQCSGEYWKDTVTLGSEYYFINTNLQTTHGALGAKILAQQFGVVSTSSQIYTGILGVGLGQGLGTPYPNVIDQLAAQGVTASRVFSTFLGNVNTASGTSPLHILLQTY